MLLTITTTAEPATDLGFLLHKHPDKVQAFQQAYGVAHVFYPEASARRCTAALLLEVDPVRLVRSRGRTTPDFTLGQYVNDRPYAASSLLSTAMSGVFRTAMRGRCDLRPDLAASPIPLEIHLPALPCRGGPEAAVALFAPLGWQVEARPIPLDEGFPEWGDSRYVTLTLTGDMRLADALNQIYVLLPVLDDAKHYWIAPDEVDKLIRAGEGWLAAHPERGRITRRYLANRNPLIRTALGRLADADDAPDDALDRDSLDEEPSPDDASPPTDEGPPADEGRAAARQAPTAEEAFIAGEAGGGPERAADGDGDSAPVSLNELRLRAVVDVLGQQDVRSVIDLGCGSGKLLARLMRDPAFAKVTGTDVSSRAVAAAERRLRLDRLPVRQAERLQIFQGSVVYADKRFAGHDAAVLMEVIEHIDQPRLEAVERVVLGGARPRIVIVTTPNAEYNTRYEGLTGHRHSDHRFEWTRAEFRTWADRAAESHGYRVRYLSVGDEDPELGPPTQMGVFTL